MMRIAKIEMRGPVPGNLSEGDQKQIIADAWSRVGHFWHRELLDKHFTNAASTEYGYTARQGESGRPGKRGFHRSYTGRKLRLKGHTRPLEYTGKSKERAKGMARVVVRQGKGWTEARVVMNSPGFNRRYSGSPINMRAELTTISQREVAQLTDVLNDGIQVGYQLKSGSF